jgi:hypothetical protein
MKRFLFLVAIFGFSNSAFSGEVLCLGPKDARESLIYLHGMDPVAPSSQELATRADLERLGHELGLRVAVPRSQTLCPKDKTLLCWPQTSRDTLSLTWEKILSDSALCFTRTPSDPILLGFSNGAYFATQLWQECLPSGPRRVLAIGSGETRREKAPAASCGRLTLLVGRRDQVLPSARAFHKRLLARKSKIDFIEFDGGHQVDPSSIKSFWGK